MTGRARWFDKLWARGNGPQAPALEPIEIPSPEITSQPAAHFVVDFGTSGTVVIGFEPPTRGFRDWAPQYFTAPRIASSVIAVQGAGGWVRVGDEAREIFRSQPDGWKLYPSLKRFLELQSRQGDPANALIALSNTIEKYLQAVVLSGPLTVARAPFNEHSRVVVSVPNSFNGRAIAAVAGAVAAVFAQRSGRTSDQVAHQVDIIREGEAVAHLYAHLKRTPEFPVTLVPMRGSGPSVGDMSRSAVLALDVGAGTSDLTVFDVTETTVHVLLSCGVPIGGSDVDRVLLGGLAVDPATVASASQVDRAELEFAVQDRKVALDGAVEGFFREPEFIDWLLEHREFSRSIVPNASAEGRPLPNLTAEKSEMRLSGQVDRLVRWSVSDLFDMVPPSLRARVGSVLLTGRGSSLAAVRNEVSAWAQKLNASAWTVANRDSDSGTDALKLAVALGGMVSAQIDTNCVSGLSDSVSVGRRIVLVPSDSELADVELTADTRWSNFLPTLWSVGLDGASEMWQQQVAGGDADKNEKRIQGLSVQVSDNRLKKTSYVLWSSQSEHYSLPTGGGWTVALDTVVDPTAESPLTGLPIAFPNEGG